MKTLTITKLNLIPTSFLLFLLLAASASNLLVSCGSKVKAENIQVSLNNNPTSMDIPPLKERTGELSKAEEWTETQSRVSELNIKIQQNPNDIQSRLKIATIYLVEARITGEHPYYYPAILKILEGVLLLEPQNFEALTFKASVLMSQHRFKDALQVAESARNINPDNAYIYGVLVDANIELGYYEEAIKMSDKMQSMKPSLESYSRASYLREIYGDYQGAIEAMQLAVKAGLPGSEAYCWSKKTLGYLYEQTGQMDKAKKTYKEIILERPSYAFALEGLARVEKYNKDYEAALKYLNDAAAIMPEFSFHEEMADIYALQGELEKSNKKYLEVIDMLKEDAASGHIVYLDLSKIYIKSNMLDSAMVYGQKEYDMRPNNIDVNRNLAEIYFLQGNVEKAKEHLSVANRTGCKNPELVVLTKKIQSAK